MPPAKTSHSWSLLGELLANPITIICLTLLALVLHNEFICGRTILNDVFVDNGYSDMLVRAAINGSNHVHPWLATSVTIVVLILIIVVIILYAGALEEM